MLRVLSLGLALLPAGVVRAQAALTAAALRLQLKPGETVPLRADGAPGSLQVVEVALHGGLVSLESAETGRRLLDLGDGGLLRFAVRVPASGAASVSVLSSERLRPALLSVRLLPVVPAEEASREHLLAAGIAFARADSARRHQPHAPETADALAEYDRAAAEAAAGGDVPLERWALAQKARFLLYGKSSFVDTRALLLRAAALPGAGDEAAQALVYKTLSSCEYYLGDLPAAAADAERALALYRQTGDRYWQGVVLGNLIADDAALGRDADAAAAAREALSDAEATQDTAGVVFSLTELAGLYHQQGQLELAFQAFREAGAWAADIRYAPLIQAEIEQALGSFYLELGLPAEAEEQLKLCLEHTPPESAEALEARGLLARAAERRGDVRGAFREYDAALAIARRQHLPAQEAGLLLDRSSAWLAARQPAKALEDARAAGVIAEASSPGLRIDSTLAEAAACEQGCAAAADAEPLYRRALAAIDSSGAREQEARAWAGLAGLHAHEAHGNAAQLQAALGEVDRALALLEHSRASLASRDLAAGLFAERRGWYSLATDLAMQLDGARPGQGFADVAFRYTERARARAMLDALGQPAPAASATGSALGARAASNAYRIAEEQAKLLAAKDPGAVARNLRALYREQDALETEGRAQQQTTAALASVQDVQRHLLGEDAALIAFAPGLHGVFRWVITRTGSRVDRLPPLSAQLLPVQAMLAGSRPEPQPGEDAAKFGERLARFRADRDAGLQRAGALLLPLLPGRIHRVYVVADGSLPALPWAALRMPCAEGTCYAVQRYTLAAEPSASVALLLARRQPVPAMGALLLVSNTLPPPRTANPGWVTLVSLPGSRRETAAIAQVAGRYEIQALQGPAATVDGVRAGMQQPLRVAHFAAHTVLVPGHPELSGITLSPSGSGSGVLWLQDIQRLHSPPLVVLSGCSTQGAAGLGGEDLGALAQAFFYAGAQSVVATYWLVDDDSTVPLMREFYRSLLLEGRDPAAAMRQAQLRSIRAGADVADWSAFVVDGVSSPAADTRNVAAR